MVRDGVGGSGLECPTGLAKRCSRILLENKHSSWNASAAVDVTQSLSLHSLRRD